MTRIGSERSHEVEVPGVADGRDVGAEVPGQLHGRRPDGSGGTVDEDAPPFPKVRLAEARQREARSVADGSGLVERHAGRHVRQRGALPDADKLGVRAVGPGAEDMVADLELDHGGAHCRDLARELHAQDPMVRSAEAGEEAARVEFGASEAAVGPVDRRGVDPDEHLVVLRHRPSDLFHSEDLRRPITVVDNGTHRQVPSAVRCSRWIGPPRLQALPAR